MDFFDSFFNLIVIIKRIVYCNFLPKYFNNEYFKNIIDIFKLKVKHFCMSYFVKTSSKVSVITLI